ncbi:MAG: hypothetical protein ACM337_00895, partial [Syntrophaceae bacterium]
HSGGKWDFGPIRTGPWSNAIPTRKKRDLKKTGRISKRSAASTEKGVHAPLFDQPDLIGNNLQNQGV